MMNLTDNERELLKNTWDLFKEEPDNGRAILERLVEKYPKYVKWFPEKDMDKLTKMHVKSFTKVINFIDTNKKMYDKQVDKIIRKHKKEDVKIDMFDDFSEVLIEVLKEKLHPDDLTDEAIAAWRKLC
ncbi:unnamed protein product, partial [Oppiella nova]